MFCLNNVKFKLLTLMQQQTEVVVLFYILSCPFSLIKSWNNNHFAKLIVST